MNFQPQKRNEYDDMEPATSHFQRQLSNHETMQRQIPSEKTSNPQESPYEFGPDNVSVSQLQMWRPENNGPKVLSYMRT